MAMNRILSLAVAGAAAWVIASPALAIGTDGALAHPTPAPAAPGAPGEVPKGQVSAAAGKDLQAVQKALNSTPPKYDEALAGLDKVKNNPKKNEYDEYVMNEFYVSTYAGQKKLEEAAAPLEAIMVSKYMPPDELKRRVVQAAYVYYELKNYDKAIELGNRAVKDGSAPEQLQLAIAQAYYLKNDFKGADHYVHDLADEQVKAGQTPTGDMLEIGLSAAAKLNDEASERHWLELLVSYHPKPEYWENLLEFMYHNKLTDRQTLQLYRLSADVGTLKRGSDYAEMAQLALDAGSPGEAVTTLTKGFAANAFTDPAETNRNQHLLESAKKQSASDQATLAKTEASAAGAATGDALVGVGIGYFGYGDYEKAAKDIAAGLAKGTAKDATDARLILGISQIRTGDKDGAVKTFKSVKGDAVYERLAELWVLRTRT
jgi:hypothetical protein